MKKRIKNYLDLLIESYPNLEKCKDEIGKAHLILEDCYEHDSKLLIAGNGGFAVDSEDIVG